MLQIFAIIDDTSVMNFRKNLQHNFPKMRGEGSKAAWNFSKKSSVLEGVGFPKREFQASNSLPEIWEWIFKFPTPFLGNGSFVQELELEILSFFALNL